VVTLWRVVSRFNGIGSCGLLRLSDCREGAEQ